MYGSARCERDGLALSWPLPVVEEDDPGLSGGRITPGGKDRPLASNTCTVRRPGFKVVSEVGFAFDVEVVDEVDEVDGATFSFPDEVA